MERAEHILCRTLGQGTTDHCERWAQRYDGPSGEREAAFDLALGPAGETVYVTGRSGGQDDLSDAADLVVAAYDAGGGTERWVTRFDGPGGGLDWPSDLVIGPDGEELFVTGITWSGQARGYDQLSLALDAQTGDVTWHASIDIHGELDRGRQIRVSPDGDQALIGGQSSNATGNLDLLLTARNTTQGALQWSRTVDGPSHGQERPAALRLAPHGGKLFVVGDSSLTRGIAAGYQTADGNRLWTTEIPIQGDAVVNAGTLASDESTLYGVGSAGNPFQDIDLLAFALKTSDGSVQWLRQQADGHESAHPPDIEEATEVELAREQELLLVTGTSAVHEMTVMGTAALASGNGSVLWSKRALDAPQASGVGVDVEAVGELLVAVGQETDPARSATIRIVGREVETGEKRWSTRFDHPGLDEEPRALALSPEAHRFFLTGTAERIDDPGDLLTLSYETPDPLVPLIPRTDEARILSAQWRGPG